MDEVGATGARSGAAEAVGNGTEGADWTGSPRGARGSVDPRGKSARWARGMELRTAPCARGVAVDYRSFQKISTLFRNVNNFRSFLFLRGREFWKMPGRKNIFCGKMPVAGLVSNV